MLNIVLYFQVHQPWRLRHYRVLDIGRHDYFDEELNRSIIEKVSTKCYRPTNQLLGELLAKHEGRFKIAFSVTGTVVEQLRQFQPDALQSFRELARTGAVEFLGETYYHSLACLFDHEEFLDQVRMHSALMQEEFGFHPTTFRNTELIYCNLISDLVAELPAFKTILTEGADHILKWRSPLHPYRSYSHKHALLLKYYTLSDDIAFRFSDRNWVGYPLTAEKFVGWLNELPLSAKGHDDLFLNLFMDYETFGEHQWSDTGIFEFLREFPSRALDNKFTAFIWPSEALDSTTHEPEALDVPNPISWADTERDLSAWLSNPMQWDALRTFYEILARIKTSGKGDLLSVARRLSSSDLYYYMCTKYYQDGDVHKYFSPYSSPEEAYVFFMNVLADLETGLEA